MNKNEFKRMINNLKFDEKDTKYLMEHNLSLNIFDYTPLEIKYIKEKSHDGYDNCD